MFDPAKVKADFPILQRKVHDKPLTYLDSAATSQKPEAVISAVDLFYREHNANPHRGLYQLSEEATAMYEGARKTVAEFIGANSPKELIFTRSATEALNLFAWGWASHHVSDGDVIVLTEMEHHANIVPWHILKGEYDIDLRFVRVTEKGHLDLDDLADKVRGAKVLGLTMASNVLGTINPVAEATKIARKAGAKVVVDAAQAAPHIPIDVRELGVDALAIAGHKMMGPTGIGALWVEPSTLAEMNSVYGGGEMIKEVRLDGYEPAEPPQKFEPGTMPVADAIGLGAAVDYASQLGMYEIRSHEETLTAYALNALPRIEGLTIYGPTDPAERVGLVSFTVEGVHAHDLASLLDQDGIAIRSGHHCAQPLHDKLGVPATARASFSIYNSTEDIDRLVESIKSAQKTFST
jgi:cysteine desulfurase/selenocysteine lyase